MKTPVHITPSRASKSAIDAVEKLGGTVFCKYYNPLALQDCVKGRTDRRSAAPTRREDICAYQFPRILTLCVFNCFLFSVVHQLAEQRVPFKREHRENANCGRSLETTGRAVTHLEGAGLRCEEDMRHLNTLLPTCRFRVHTIRRYTATA